MSPLNVSPVAPWHLREDAVLRHLPPLDTEGRAGLPRQAWVGHTMCNVTARGNEVSYRGRDEEEWGGGCCIVLGGVLGH